MSSHCLSCGAGLSPGMRFCGACGAPVERRCANCGSQAAPGQRFCGECGTSLGGVPAPERERRLVSVLFCDLVGFTAFSESRDPEDVRDVLDQYFASARRIIDAYGGMVEKFIGDAVMAVWGAPLAREDDAERAVRAALELVRSVDELGARLAIPDLQLRVGVLTGEAAVQVGSAYEGMVTGDAVNTASRIQSVARPGSVLVDDTTRLATEASIAFRSSGTQAVKGKASPLRLWRALHIRDQIDSVSSGTVEPPFVGRTVHLEAIGSALEALEAGEAGVTIVKVLGDAGIGKSRLGRELQKQVRRSGTVSWYRGRSMVFGDGAGLSALAEIVRTNFGIARDDVVESQRDRITQLLLAQFADDDERGRVERALHRLLDLDDRRELIEQGELFSAWRSWLEHLAVENPVALVFEELQRADQSLLDFIAHLGEWSGRSRLLILALSREDPRLDTSVAPGHRVELEPLADDEMDALVAGAVDGAPEGLRAAIRAEGGGIPLYAVEVLRALADRDVLAVRDGHYVVRGELGEVSVPPTIRALIASRIDSLDELERRLLSAAAVLGENFSATGVAAISEVPLGQARELLDGLVAKAFLGFEEDPRSSLRGRYSFLQGVVRRVVADRLSRRERKRLHLAAVDHLSERAQSEPELAAVLAGHLLAAVEAAPQAEDVAEIRSRALTTLRTAAERAAAVGALAEAVSLFDRAADLSIDELERAALLESAGETARRAGDADTEAARFQAAGAIHGAAGRERERVRLRALELRAYRYTRRPSDLLPALHELEDELAGAPDALRALVDSVLAYALYQHGDHEEALAVASRAASTAERCGEPRQLVDALSVQGSALIELERPEDAIAVYGRALALATRHDRRHIAPFAANLAVALASLGEYSEAADRAREAIAAAVRAAERVFERHARLILGRALCALGEWDEAATELESVKADVPPFLVGMALAPLVVIALARGQDARVRDLLAEYDRRCGSPELSAFEIDFRVLRSAASMIVDGAGADELSRLITDAQAADYAEWAGWLSPIIDRLVTEPASEPLERALAALHGPGRMKQTPPVEAQRQRLEAHLAVRAGEHARGVEGFNSAHRLLAGCGLVFEAAVVALEGAERAVSAGDTVDESVLLDLCATFEGLGAAPWLERARRLKAAALGAGAG